MKAHRTSLWNQAALLATVALLAASGCHKKTPPPTPTAMAPTSTMLPPTASITADPLSIDLGQSVVLNWRSTNASSVSIDGIGEVPVNGTQTVSPSSSTNFHLVAKNDGGTTEANVRVTVRVPEVPAAPTDNGGGGSDAEFHAHVQDIFFGYDSYDLTPQSDTSISAAAAYLNAHPGIKILIGGYCDDRGSAEYNITLGENRANAAKTALVAAGVNGDRIRVVSYGKEKQFCTDETESCWQQNRRDQFSIDR
ncbi:MAG TPA: OmpA family protein [Acidobacteriaceae bacterium]|jgi:peptidoglycan-associated lipoprotein|nr:OmpA family protein [Acidobacteriaceae bacterium]